MIVDGGRSPRGWAFPVRPTAGGGIALSGETRRLEESIWIVLGTARGESLMSPSFGSKLAQAGLAPGYSRSLGAAEYLAREALERCEPRIDVVAVHARFAPEDEKRVLLEVEYRSRSTGETGKTVYPHPL
ncbi:MAG: GPW/gp25 family protein [Planctomycetes bacterium]|nr:GPW/gp25 family protein [Planctomycetota bacterium]